MSNAAPIIIGVGIALAVVIIAVAVSNHIDRADTVRIQTDYGTISSHHSGYLL